MQPRRAPSAAAAGAPIGRPAPVQIPGQGLPDAHERGPARLHASRPTRGKRPSGPVAERWASLIRGSARGSAAPLFGGTRSIPQRSAHAG